MKTTCLKTFASLFCLALIIPFFSASRANAESPGTQPQNGNGQAAQTEELPNTNTDKSLKSQAVSVVKEEVRSDGVVERYFSDGSMEFTVKYPDGVTRSFKFKEGFSKSKTVLSQPEFFTVTSSDDTSSIWRKLKDDLYEEDGVQNRLKVEVKKDGTYTFRNLTSGYSAIRDLKGNVETVEPFVDGSLLTVRNGQQVAFELGETKVLIQSNTNGEPVKITSEKDNLVFTRQTDGTWLAAKLDATKAAKTLSDFEKKVTASGAFSPSAKVRIVENWKKFEADSSFTAQQKTDFKKSVFSLIDANSKSPFTDKERANYADQLLFHVVHLNRNAQGKNNSCNVTVLRGLLSREHPEVLAKIVAEVVNSGEFKTKDGSVIKLPADFLRPISGQPENTFPPSPGKRTALGKLWDVVAINVYYQRQTVDELGYVVSKGSLTYQEVKPTSSSDTGNRLVREYSNGTLVALGKSKNGKYYYVDQPRMFASRIADIHYQMTGFNLKGKFLIHANRGVGNSTTFNTYVGNKINDKAELEGILKSGGLPVIIQGNTGILKQRYQQQNAVNKGQSKNSIGLSSGGEHVWLVTAYDAATKTVTIDNSWYPGYDVLSKSDAKAQGKNMKLHVAVTLDDLYNSMQRSSSGSGGYQLLYVKFKK